MARLETGKVQCGDDWPGIFIRGDNAAAYHIALYCLVKRAGIEMNEIPVRNLLAVLKEANARNGIEPQMVTMADKN